MLVNRPLRIALAHGLPVSLSKIIRRANTVQSLSILAGRILPVRLSIGSRLCNALVLNSLTIATYKDRTMRKIDFTRGLGFALLMLISALGFYGTLWLMLAIAYIF